MQPKTFFGKVSFKVLIFQSFGREVTPFFFGKFDACLIEANCIRINVWQWSRTVFIHPDYF